MERTPVKSGFLAAIGYNPETQMLEVEFGEGRVYQYFGVEPEVHKSLMEAESIGRFYSRAISGRYRHRRATELEKPKPKEADEQQGALPV